MRYVVSTLIVNVGQLVGLSDDDFVAYAAQLKSAIPYQQWFDLLNRGTENPQHPDYAANVQILKDLNASSRLELYSPLEAFFSAAGIRRWRREWDYKGGEDDHIPRAAQSIDDIIQTKAY